jgi:hypothetical protein
MTTPRSKAAFWIVFAVALVGAMFMNGAARAGTRAMYRTMMILHDARPPRSGGYMSSAVGTGQPVLYVADNARGTIVVFSQSHPGAGAIGQISGLSAPTGVAVDAQHNVWVQTATQIESFHRGSTTPFTTFAAGGGVGLTFDSHGKTYATTSGNEVDVCAAGSTTRFAQATTTISRNPPNFPLMSS